MVIGPRSLSPDGRALDVEGSNLPPPVRMCSESKLSECSVDSGSNLVSQSDFVEGSSAGQGDLPYFHPSGDRDATASLTPKGSLRFKWSTAFRGWDVALKSCRSAVSTFWR